MGFESFEGIEDGPWMNQNIGVAFAEKSCFYKLCPAIADFCDRKFLFVADELKMHSLGKREIDPGLYALFNNDDLMIDEKRCKITQKKAEMFQPLRKIDLDGNHNRAI